MDTIRKLNYLFTTKIKWQLVGVFACITIGSFAELLGVSVILPIVNLAIDENSMSENIYVRILSSIFGVTDRSQLLIIILLFTIVLYIVKNAYLSWMTYIMNTFCKSVRMYYCMTLLNSYMKQPYSYFLTRNSAEIIRSVSADTVNLYATIAGSLQVLSQFLTVAMVAAYLASTNFIMAIVIAVLVGGCELFCLLFLQKKAKRLGKTNQDLGAQIYMYTKQPFEGIKEVKISNQEQNFMNQYRDVFKQSLAIERTMGLYQNIPKYLLETICIGGIMGYLAIAISFGGNVAEIVPQLAVFAVGAFKLLPGANNLYQNVVYILYHKASIDVVYNDIKSVEEVDINFADEEILNGNKRLTFQNKMEIRDVSFHYQTVKKNVLENISITIKKGESIALVGESGGGKSTLADIILGLLAPQEGKILVDDVDIAQREREWHNTVGYIPQHIYILDDSIRNNVALGVRSDSIDDERIWSCLKDAQLDTFVRGLEEGLDTNVGEAGTRLSGGQRQRIGIARALYKNPEVLVFDEATSALDTETEKEVMSAIEGLHGTKTMIMIAHRLSTIENCDHVYRVGEQKVVLER